MRAKVIAVSIAMAAVLILAGCPNLVPSLTGSLAVSIGDHMNAKTLVPAISMEAARYAICGTGPGGAAFSVSSTGAPVTIDSLRFGAWTITVDAFNANSDLVGQGVGTATVRTGQSTDVSIKVFPLEGDGTLTLSVHWPATEVDLPSIHASLVSSSGTPLALPFSVEDSSAAFSSSNIPAGDYTLVIQLMDNGISVMGAVEVVRIAAGSITTGSYTFNHVHQPGGSIVVQITPALGDPIPVTLHGPLLTLARGTSMTVSASADDATANVVWVWYLDGASIGTGERITFGSSLHEGYYRLDVTGFAADGRRAGSASAEFQVLPASSGPVSASVTPIYGMGDGIEQAYPAVVVDPNASITVAFNSYSYPYKAFVISSMNGYSMPIDAGPFTHGFGDGPKLAQDVTTGLLHALVPRIGYGHGFDFFYANANDWSTQTRITNLDNVDDRYEMFGSIAASHGISHALWRMYSQETGEVRAYRIQYAASLDWNAWQYVRAPDYGIFPNLGAPAMTLDDSGVVHAVWSDQAFSDRLVYARSSDYVVSEDPDPLAVPGSMRRIWVSRPLPVTDTSTFPSYDIAVGGGVIYVVQALGDIKVYASSDGGINWQQLSQVHLDSVNFQTVQAVYRDGALRIGAQGYDGVTDHLAYISSRDWVARKVLIPSGFRPRLQEGRNRKFDYRNGNAYFVWSDALAPTYDYFIALGVAVVGP